MDGVEMVKDYIIRRLEDDACLDEVYQLTHDSLVDAGDIVPRSDGKLISYPHLDRAGGTTIVCAEKDGKLVGTVSITIDGPSGLYTDRYFKEETAVIRATATASEPICATWRIATAKEFRGNSRLVRDLILESFRIARENSCCLCLFVFNDRHVKVYQRLIKAEVIARKIASVDQKIELPMVLMQMDMVHGWEKFNQHPKS